MALAIQYDDQRLSVSLGTKAATIRTGRLDGNRDNGFRLVTLDSLIGWDSKVDNEGPGLIGIALNMSQAEIETLLEDDPQSSTAIVPRGLGQYIKLLGIIPAGGTGGVLNNGNPIHTKVNWSVPEGDQMVYFMYNMDTVTLQAFGVNFFSQYTGVWLRD